MQTKQIKIGIIGCGHVATDRHIPALQQLPNAEVVALSDLNEPLLNQVADRFSVQHRYTDYRMLLENKECNAVAVCVPPQYHADIAIAALDAGKHVFIEKPLALNVDDCDRLISKANEPSKKVMVGFNLRFHRLVRKAQEMMKQEILGTPQLARSMFTSNSQNQSRFAQWRTEREQGGGVLIEVATHHFDLWRFLLNSEIDEIYAVTQSANIVDEFGTITAKLSNGVQITGTFSQSTYNNNEIEVFGTLGRLGVSCYRFDGLEFSPVSSFPGDVNTRIKTTTNFLQTLPQGILKMRRGGDWIESYSLEWQHFIEAIVENKPVESTLEDGRQAVKAMLSAVNSACIGKPVSVAQAPRSISAANSTL